MSLPGGPELIIILFVVMLLFGASKLPKLARSMGQAGKEFRAGMKEGYTEDPDACPSCGGEISSETKFCPACGAEARATA
ncbi:MAG: twin-arginine translocase TatA/TatE family subunit [Actinomycetota bacterium]